MKQVKLYLPFEVDFIHNDMHSELIERYGAHGLGIYFMLLMELRNHEGYRCRLSTLKGAARRCLADLEMLESVLCDFGLFEFVECGNRVLISSVYIDRVMQPFDEKRHRFSSTASENTVTVERPVHGMSTVTNRIIINKIETKTKTKTTTTNTKAATAAKVVDADVAVAAVADNVGVVNEGKPKAGCVTLRSCTSARTLTTAPVLCGGETAMPQSVPCCRRYPEKALPAYSRWRHCPAPCCKAPPRLRDNAVRPAGLRSGFRRKTVNPFQPVAVQPALLD